MGNDDTSAPRPGTQQQLRPAGSTIPRAAAPQLALIPISLDVRVDAKTGRPAPPVRLPSSSSAQGAGELRLLKTDVARIFDCAADKLDFVSREHVLIRTEPAPKGGMPRVIVRSLATNQVSIRRGAHAEARGAAGYSLALLAKGGEEELYVGDHLQLLNPPFDRLGCHSLTFQLSVLPPADDEAAEDDEEGVDIGYQPRQQRPQQQEDAAIDPADASEEGEANALTVRQNSALGIRPPVPLSASLFSPAGGGSGSGSGSSDSGSIKSATTGAGADDSQEGEGEGEGEEGEPALSERGLAAVFASPPLVGLGGGPAPLQRQGAGPADPTPALPPLPPPALHTQGKRPRGAREEDGEDEEEVQEGDGAAAGARGGGAAGGAAAAAGLEGPSSKRRRSLGDALLAPIGFISSLFASAVKPPAKRAAVDSDSDSDREAEEEGGSGAGAGAGGKKKRRRITAVMPGAAAAAAEAAVDGEGEEAAGRE